MRLDDLHLSDEELLMSVDGELPPKRAEQVKAHLTGCWLCRSRQAEIEATIGTFIQDHYYRAEGMIPPGDGPRALLRARMSQLAGASQPTLGLILRRFVFSWRAVATGTAALATMLAALFLAQLRPARASLTPDARLTPGVATAATRQEVCPAIDRQEHSPVTATVAKAVFQEYGIRNPQPGEYEVDYLITPALGGSTDIRNLWPQPYSAGVWNSHTKDALEDHLLQLVCDGKLDLASAQQEIAVDWIAAYKKYFRTSQPLISHLSFQKDLPWQ